jgi:hypothetical protein
MKSLKFFNFIILFAIYLFAASGCTAYVRTTPDTTTRTTVTTVPAETYTIEKY